MPKAYDCDDITILNKIIDIPVQCYMLKGTQLKWINLKNDFVIVFLL